MVAERLERTRLLGALAIALATVPLFFQIYRTAAFNTIARDDYAPYLLALVGDGGELPGAPFAYRILSVAVAVPFYYVLPVYTFTNLHDVDPAYLRAVLALSFASYLWLVATAITIYAIARSRYGATRAASSIVALATFLLSGFIGTTGVDPFAILTISLLVLWLDRPALYLPLIVLSAGINEKIPMVFSTILTLRGMVSLHARRRFDLRAQLVFSYAAVFGYFAAVFILRIPGNESQLDLGLAVEHMRASLWYSLSLKGFVLNVLPMLVLALIVMMAIKHRRQNAFPVSDVSALLVLLFLSAIADVAYNLGRIVMYAYPLYLPALCAAIDDSLEIGSGRRPAD